jgi:hypothetical protein
MGYYQNVYGARQIAHAHADGYDLFAIETDHIRNGFISHIRTEFDAEQGGKIFLLDRPQSEAEMKNGWTFVSLMMFMAAASMIALMGLYSYQSTEIHLSKAIVFIPFAAISAFYAKTVMRGFRQVVRWVRRKAEKLKMMKPQLKKRFNLPRLLFTLAIFGIGTIIALMLGVTNAWADNGRGFTTNLVIYSLYVFYGSWFLGSIILMFYRRIVVPVVQKSIASLKNGIFRLRLKRFVAKQQNLAGLFSSQLDDWVLLQNSIMESFPRRTREQVDFTSRLLYQMKNSYVSEDDQISNAKRREHISGKRPKYLRLVSIIVLVTMSFLIMTAKVWAGDAQILSDVTSNLDKNTIIRTGSIAILLLIKVIKDMMDPYIKKRSLRNVIDGKTNI